VAASDLHSGDEAAQRAQARAADVLGHALALERGQVGVDGLGDAAQVGGHRGELGPVLVALGGRRRAVRALPPG